MPYLNLDPDYFSHLKVVRLVAHLGTDSDVLPLRLWARAAKFHPEDGVLLGYGPDEIEAIIGWRGKKGKAVEALIGCGFLEKVEGGFSVCHWKDHQGHLAMFKKRARDAAMKRWENEKRVDATSIAKSMLDQCPKPDQTKPTKPKEKPPPATIDDVRAINAYAREVVGLDLTALVKADFLVVDFGLAGVVEALEHLASRRPSERLSGIEKPAAFLKSLCKRACKEQLSREGFEYEPFYAWRERRQAEVRKKVGA